MIETTDGDQRLEAYLEVARDILAELVDEPDLTIGPDAHLLHDVGLDSFGVLVFLGELEDRLAVHLPAGDEEPVLSAIYRYVQVQVAR